jgi:hypothetical protein
MYQYCVGHYPVPELYLIYVSFWELYFCHQVDSHHYTDIILLFLRLMIKVGLEPQDLLNSRLVFDPNFHH